MKALRVIRVVDPLKTNDLEDITQYKNSAVGRGGYRIEASKNLWEGSGLKIDSTSTSVAWCREGKLHCSFECYQPMMSRIQEQDSYQCA